MPYLKETKKQSPSSTKGISINEANETRLQTSWFFLRNERRYTKQDKKERIKKGKPVGILFGYSQTSTNFPTLLPFL